VRAAAAAAKQAEQLRAVAAAHKGEAERLREALGEARAEAGRAGAELGEERLRRKAAAAAAPPSPPAAARTALPGRAAASPASFAHAERARAREAELEEQVKFLKGSCGRRRSGRSSWGAWRRRGEGSARR